MEIKRYMYRRGLGQRCICRRGFRLGCTSFKSRRALGAEEPQDGRRAGAVLTLIDLGAAGETDHIAVRCLDDRLGQRRRVEPKIGQRLDDTLARARIEKLR